MCVFELNISGVSGEEILNEDLITHKQNHIHGQKRQGMMDDANILPVINLDECESIVDEDLLNYGPGCGWKIQRVFTTASVAERILDQAIVACNNHRFSAAVTILVDKLLVPSCQQHYAAGLLLLHSIVQAHPTLMSITTTSPHVSHVAGRIHDLVPTQLFEMQDLIDRLICRRFARATECLIVTMWYQSVGVNSVLSTKYLTKSAELGCSMAQTNLALTMTTNAMSSHQRLLLTDAAQQGDAMAQQYIGNHIGLKRNYQSETTAFYWWIRAAKQGLDQSQYNVGMCYIDGYYVSKNLATGVEWLLLAANQGNERAEYTLANAYKHGQGVPCDETLAQYYVNAAVQHKHPLAQQLRKQWNTTMINIPNITVSVDVEVISSEMCDKDSIGQLLQIIAKIDDAQWTDATNLTNILVNADPNCVLGHIIDYELREAHPQLYHNSPTPHKLVSTPQDIQKWGSWIKSHQSSESPTIMILQALWQYQYSNHRDVEIASLVIKSASAGNIIAMHNIFIIISLSHVSYEIARSYLTVAAAKGHVSAQMQLAKHYTHLHTPTFEDNHVAMDLLATAAATGNSAAMYYLGELLCTKFPTEESIQQGKSWLRRAHACGHPCAMPMLICIEDTN